MNVVTSTTLHIYIAPSYIFVTTSSGAFGIAQTCCMWYWHHKSHPRK